MLIDDEFVKIGILYGFEEFNDVLVIGLEFFDYGICKCYVLVVVMVCEVFEEFVGKVV